MVLGAGRVTVRAALSAVKATMLSLATTGELASFTATRTAGTGFPVEKAINGTALALLAFEPPPELVMVYAVPAEVELA